MIAVARPKIVKSITIFILLCVALFPAISYLSYLTFTGEAMYGDAIVAVLETNLSEANEYFLMQHNVWTYIMIAFFILVAYVFVKFAKTLTLKPIKYIFYIILLVLVILNITVYTKIDKVSDVYFVEYITQYFQANEKFAKNQEARLKSITNLKVSNGGVFVLVIGESQNKNYMSVYGYDKQTTPFLNELSKSQNAIFFTNTLSNHTHTSHVLRLALTAKNQYNKQKEETSASIIELANKAGFETLWLSNQVEFGLWGSPVSAIAMASKNRIFTSRKDDNELFDEILLPRIDNIKFKDKTLLVIHLMGNHGNYVKRYPKKFNKFGEETSEQAYLNSMLYNDFIVSELIKKFKNMPNFMGLIYCADHSELPGSGEHDSNKFRYQMAQIPMFAYFSDEYITKNLKIYETLKANKDEFWTNDLLFNLVGAVMGISSSLDEPKNDISNALYDKNKARFKTLHGKKTLIDEIK